MAWGVDRAGLVVHQAGLHVADRKAAPPLRGMPSRIPKSNKIVANPSDLPTRIRRLRVERIVQPAVGRVALVWG